jgi:hypothetical protein
MDRRTKAIILTVLGLLIVVVLFIIFFRFLSRADLDQTVSMKPEARAPEKFPLVQGKVEIAEGTINSGGDTFDSEANMTQTELSRLAASFAERFGSYSSESDFSNITDLKVFMTEEMQPWADKYRAELQAKYEKQDEYYGVNTRAVSVKSDLYDAEGGRADFTVITQRSETYGAKAPTVRYENMIIRMRKVSEQQWKVDYAKWE